MDNAFERFEELLEQDQHDAEVQYQLGLCYLHGEGTGQDGQKAEEWFRLAAEQGHPGAKAMLTSAAPQEQQLPPLARETLPEWCMAAEDGDDEAQYQVAAYFLAQEPQEKEEALRYLEAAVRQGNAKACLLLAKLLLPEDPAAAVVHLRNAADCDLSEAEALLAQCYAEGRGVGQDMEKAEQHFIHSAQVGGSEEMLALAVRFAVGDGVEMSMGKAMRWVHQAQEAGEPMAQELFQTRYAACLEAKKKERAEQKLRMEAEAHRRSFEEAFKRSCQEQQRQKEEQQAREAAEEQRRRAAEVRAQNAERERRRQEEWEAQAGRRQIEETARLKRCSIVLLACPAIALFFLPAAADPGNAVVLCMVLHALLPLVAFAAADVMKELQPDKRYLKIISPRGVGWITVAICWYAVIFTLLWRHFAKEKIQRIVYRILS